MIRHCDGTDPNLTMDVPESEVGERLVSHWPSRHPGHVVIACDCGRTFDDVDMMTTYPHRQG
jgi:hypothetical protein